MTFEELQNELQALIGQTVSYSRIAANSIIIYFYGEPGDESVVSVFIDPSWRYQKDGKVVVGSYDLQIDQSDFDTEEEYEEKFDLLCSLIDEISGSNLLNIDLDPESSDISMEFSGGQKLRNFANSGFDDKQWTYRNLPKGITAYVSPLGVKMVDKKKSGQASTKTT